LLGVFFALFVQLQLILFISMLSGTTAVFLSRAKFQWDFPDLFHATSDWLHGINPYLNVRIVTPPPSVLATLLLQPFTIDTAAVLFLIVNLTILAASLWSICSWLRMNQRESLLLFGIASMFFPVIFFVASGNLDGMMLGLMLVSLLARNRFLRASALSLSICFKAYSILLLFPFLLARQWKRVMATLALMLLLFLSFHSLFWEFIVAQTRRSTELRGQENLCPIGGVAHYFALDHAHAAAVVYLMAAYLALWIASYAFMLFRNRGAGLTAQAVYSFAWMLALPLAVFPYTGVLLLPLLALRSHEIAEKGFAAIPDRLFLIGFCLVGFQQTAMSSFFPAHPHQMWLFYAVNPLGTALVILSLVLQSSRPGVGGQKLVPAGGTRGNQILTGTRQTA
jgi:hypothetical protein